MLRAFLASLAALTLSIPAARADVPALEEVLKAFDVRQGEVQSLALPGGELWMPTLVQVNLGGQTVEIELTPKRVRSPNYFRVQTMDASGKPTVLDDPAPVTYTGTIAQMPGARVRASLVGGRLSASIWLPGGDGWTIQPVSSVFPDAGEDQHLVFRSSETITPPNRCGLEEIAQPLAGQAFTGRAQRGPGTVKLIEIAFDVDFEYYTLNGSNTTTVVNDIESIMNVVEGIYEGENVNLQFEITVINIRTANAAPYSGITNANLLLTALQNEWSGGNPSLGVSAVRRDVVHMFTNKPIDSGSGIIGIAFLSGMCRIQPDVFNGTAIAYGLSKSRWSANTNNRASVTGHEVGHNMSATHCNEAGNTCTGQPNCNMMCASVGGCGPNITLWGTCTANLVAGYRDSGAGACMGILQPPIATLPFLDQFPTGSVSSANWAYNFNTAVVTPPLALQPAPSANLVLAMNAVASIRDEIRTNFINLAGAPATTELSFFVNRNGVPSGARIYVDYWANNLRWVQIDSILSDGVTPTSWNLRKYTLPTAARHAESRIRFRLDTITTSTQVWYLDNVRVGAPLPVQCSLADITDIGDTGAGPDGQLTVDDIITFVNAFSDEIGCPGTAPCNIADVTDVGDTGAGPDGQLTVDDVIAFVNAFSNGCP